MQRHRFVTFAVVPDVRAHRDGILGYEQRARRACVELQAAAQREARGREHVHAGTAHGDAVFGTRTPRQREAAHDDGAAGGDERKPQRELAGAHDGSGRRGVDRRRSGQRSPAGRESDVRRDVARSERPRVDDVHHDVEPRRTADHLDLRRQEVRGERERRARLERRVPAGEADARAVDGHRVGGRRVRAKRDAPREPRAGCDVRARSVRLARRDEAGRRRKDDPHVARDRVALVFERDDRANPSGFLPRLESNGAAGRGEPGAPADRDVHDVRSERALQ